MLLPWLSAILQLKSGKEYVTMELPKVDSGWHPTEFPGERSDLYLEENKKSAIIRDISNSCVIEYILYSAARGEVPCH